MNRIAFEQWLTKNHPDWLPDPAHIRRVTDRAPHGSMFSNGLMHRLYEAWVAGFKHAQDPKAKP